MKTGFGANTQNIIKALQALADAKKLPLSQVNYSLNYNLQFKIDQPSKNNYTITPQLISCNGDQVMVGGFDITNEFIPDQLNYTVTAKFNRTLNNIKQFNHSYNIITGRFALITFTDTAGAPYLIEAQQVAFNYTPATLNALIQKLTFINQYFEHENILAQLNARLNFINPNDVENLDPQHTELISIEHQLSQTENLQLVDKLNLNLYDPSGFMQKLNAVKTKTVAARNALNIAKATAYSYFFQKGMELKARNNRFAARNYFTRSLREQPFFAPAAFELALLDYEDKKFKDAECLALSILYDMNPDPATSTNTQILIRDIYTSYLNLADINLQNKQFQRALEITNDAANLQNQSKGIVPNSKDVGIRFAKAHEGFYQSLLENSKTEFSNNHFNQAEQKVKEALRYQQRNSDFIPNAFAALEMQQVIFQKKYQLKVDEALSLTQTKQYAKALQAFDEAEQMAATAGLNIQNNLTAERKAAAKPYILNLIEGANEEIRANKLNNARAILADVRSIANRYDLNTDNSTAQLIKNLSNNIFSQACINSQNEFDRHFNQGRIALLAGEWIKADEHFNNAQGIVNANSDCSLDTYGMQLTRDSINNAVYYQRQMVQVLQLQSNGRNEEAVALFLEAEKFHQTHSIIQFYINHPSMANFAKEKGSNFFVLAVAKYYQQQQANTAALDLYKNLALKNVKNKYYKKEITTLGTAMALKDKGLNNNLNLKQKAITYTDGHKLLKPFVKAYLKALK
jgi:hypothetical protein